MKRGFTLVEVIAALAILLIVGSLTFEVFNSSYRLINRERILTDMQDSFRSITLDIEKEIRDYSIIDYKIKDIESFNVSNYKEVEPILLINKDKDSVLYFKGKKNSNDVYVFEKIIFDTNNIKNDTIYAKETKTLINKMDGNITLSSLVNNLAEIKFNFNNNSKNIRIYSTTINLDKNITQEVVEIDNGEKYIEDFLQSIKHNVNVAGTLSSSNSNDKLNILKGSIGYKKIEGWNQQENPGNIENTIIISSGKIEIKRPYGTGHGDTVDIFNAENCIFYSTNLELEQKKGFIVIGKTFSEILSLKTKDEKELRDELKTLLINSCN